MGSSSASSARPGGSQRRGLCVLDGIVQHEDPVEIAKLENPSDSRHRTNKNHFSAALARPFERADDDTDPEGVHEVQLRDVKNEIAGTFIQSGDHCLAEFGRSRDIKVSADAEQRPRRARPAVDPDRHRCLR